MRRQGTPAPYEPLGGLVMRARIWHRLTQEELAERMATSASAISRLERGRHRPNIETLEKVGEALGIALIVGFEDAGELNLVRVPRVQT